MRNLKKFLALVLAFMMTMSLMVTAHADFVEDYTDRDEVENYGDAVDFLNGLGVFKGYEDGKFQPKAEISRAEVTAIVYRMMTGDVGDKQVGIYANYPSQFSDVPHGLWYEGYVNYCANGLYVHGDPDGTFRPNASITGYEVLAIVLRTLGYGEQGEFEGAGWETRTATTAKRLGITDNVVEVLSRNATREMVAEILYQTLTTATVTYTYTYEKDVLVSDTDTNRKAYSDAGYTGDLPIYDTLLYRNFQIVGQRKYVRDNYGRPSVEWVKDNAGDTVKNGDKYVQDASDIEAFTLTLKPVKTYYVEKTECDVAKEVNSDKSLTNVSEWLNGGRVVYGGDGSTTPYVMTRTLDALHTTVDVIGAQGRTTEIYKVDGGWNIVYIDTLLGVVSEIVPRTFDTNNHVYQVARMTIKVNDNAAGAVSVVETSADTDFEDYKVGQEVLLTTYGYNDWQFDNPGVSQVYLNTTTAAGASAFLKADAQIPNEVADFQIVALNSDKDNVVAADWAVDLAEGLETKDVTVKGTVGAAEDKTGLIDTNNATHKSSNVFHADSGVVDTAKPGYFAVGSYVPSNHSGKLTNSLMNRNAKLFLFVAPDETESVVGVTFDSTSTGIGVITAMELVRASVGSYVMEASVFKADNTTETLKLVTWKNGGWSFISSTDVATQTGVSVKDDAGDNQAATWNILIEWTPVTLGGQTYAGVIAAGNPEADNTEPKDGSGADAEGILVQAGVSDTLRTDTVVTTSSVNDGTDFIFAGTAFDYSLEDGQNTGRYVLGSLAGYTGFKTIPTVYGLKGDAMVQEVSGTYYVYPKLNGSAIADGVKYSYVAQPGINVDDTYLVLSTVATYPDHATYRVIRNGTIEELNVANINDGGAGLNTLIEQAMAANELIRVAGRNANGYATAITVVDGTYNLGRCDSAANYNNLAALTLLKQSVVDSSVKTATIDKETVTKVTYGGSVLTLTNATDASQVEYLTVADDCQVQIVNVDRGFVTEGTMNSIKQYRSAATAGDEDASHELVFELNAYGYVCNIYIID